MHNFEYMQAPYGRSLYDGQWHLFDPTYGTSFMTGTHMTGQPNSAARELFSKAFGQYALWPVTTVDRLHVPIVPGLPAV